MTVARSIPLRSIAAAALALACSSACTPATTSSAAIRPNVDPARYRGATTEKFDPRTIAAYAGTHADVYAYIDAHRAEHVQALQRWVRQPSISAQNKGIPEMAALLQDDLRALGFKEVALVPTQGHPGVWGWYDAGAPRTLAVYMMYDVQPVEPEGWNVDAFAGEIVAGPLGKVLMARGAVNQKGPERAFLNAVEAILATRGKLPVNLMVVAEGEEELGSPHFPEVIDRYEDRLRTAEGVIFPFPGQSAAGDVSFPLGVKGILYFELEARGDSLRGPERAEIHGSYKALVDAPVWRLTQALATLTSPDGNTIRVPGYHDAIRPPTEEELRLVNGMADDWTQAEPRLHEVLGVHRWVDGVTGRDALMRLLFTTTLNIDGIYGGYTGEGTKTILPHRAVAKVDSRLVPNQHPDSALALIRRHLDANGFADLEIRKLSGYPPAQTSVSARLVQAAIGAYNKTGLRVSVAPRLAGSAPYYVFTDRLRLPMIPAGIGHGSGQHAPNEYLVVEPASGSRIAGLAEMEKFYVDLLYALAEAR